MPKKYADGIKLIKRRNKLFVFGLLVLIVSVLVFAGKGLASLIKYGSISIFGASSSGYTLYAVNFGSFDKADDANALAQQVSLRGAGAYVLEQDGKYCVLGCVYPNEQDANSVVSNIKEYNCSILPLKYKKMSYNFKSLDKAQNKEIKNIVEYLKNVYSTIYDNVIKLDKKELSSVAVSNNFNYLKSECKTKVATLMQINNNINNSQVGQIVNWYMKIIDSIDNCVSKLIQSSNASYVAKYSLCEVSVCMQKMYNDVN